MRITITLNETETWAFERIRTHALLSGSTDSAVAKALFNVGLREQIYGHEKPVRVETEPDIPTPNKPRAGAKKKGRKK